ncbi:WW domain containing protein [Musa troglodytarum]|uniref:WW domain containing protein n=1 Tax=Musa troglodytarum TaxID=320322 RepID=A0A9E7FC71_9LILI|nr:WW domain containing protein [Musa troglodytarum]
MDHAELSLGLPGSMLSESTSSASTESDAISKRKRKLQTWDHGIDLHLDHPLPLEWEQCLDLQSGKMYYLNRKTMKKSWVRLEEKSMELELNISTFGSSETKKQCSSSGGSMVALVCVNCHLLVMLRKSSPSCPNCKYVHSLPPPPPQKLEAVKPLETLSLLH